MDKKFIHSQQIKISKFVFKYLFILSNTHTQPFYDPSGTSQVSQCQKNLLLDFMVLGRITRADTSTFRVGTTPSGLISDPPLSPAPHFYARCPSCHYPPNLSWLGTGIKYAGLHTQWLGFIHPCNHTTPQPFCGPFSGTTLKKGSKRL